MESVELVLEIYGGGEEEWVDISIPAKKSSTYPTD